MKHTHKLFAALLVILSLAMPAIAQNTFPASGSAGIGTTSPASSAALDVTSTSQGVLVPRMTKSQRDNIVSPVTGLLIYQTNNTPGFYYYSGSAWTAVSGKSANTSLSNLAATSVNQSLISSTNNSFDLGSSSLGWKNFYLSGSIYSGSVRMFNVTDNNFFSGKNSGIATTGLYNTSVGNNTLYSNTTGYSLTAIGHNSMYANTTGYDNTSVGDSSLSQNSNGYYNVAVGTGALYNNTTATRNCGVGYFALNATTTGVSNTAVGTKALSANTTGRDNTAFGVFSLNESTTGNENTALGKSSMVHNSTGSDNTAVGNHSLYSSTSLGNQVAVGDSSLALNDGGSGGNTAVGSNSGYSTTTGSQNTFMGFEAGQAVMTGNQNTLIGNTADVSAGTLSNACAIGYAAQVTSSNAMRFGNSSVNFWGFGANSAAGKALIVGSSSSNGNGAYLTNGGAWTNGSSRNLKENFSSPDKNEVLQKINSLSVQRWMYKGTENEYHIGPIAEDFYAAFKVGHDDKSISTIDPAGVALIGIQALSDENDKLKTENEALKSQMNDVLARLDAMEKSLSQCCSNYQPASENEKMNQVSDAASLEQNLPNPFDQSTVIKLHLPFSAKNAQLIITDVAGNVLRQFDHLQSGFNQLVIHAAELPAGTYYYTLVIDGKNYETKKMELTR